MHSHAAGDGKLNPVRLGITGEIFSMDWRERFYCGELSQNQEGKEVLLMGWVDAIRDHGKLLFIHLRDVRGIVQVVFNSETSADCYRKASSLKEELITDFPWI